MAIAQKSPIVADAAREVAELLRELEACDDPARLRAGLWVLAVAIPDLLVTVDPVMGIIATARNALDGTWP